MFRRLLALSLFPAAAALLVGGIAIWSRRAPVAAFSSLALALTLVGLVVLMGPLYSSLSAVRPMLADQAFFWVFPFVPVLLAVAISAHALLRRETRE